MLLHTRISGVTWVAVCWRWPASRVLTLDDVAGLSGIGYGEALIFAAALLYALHIVGLGAWSTAQDAVGMALIQCIVIAVICGIAAAPGGIVLPDADRRLALDHLHGRLRRRGRAARPDLGAGAPAAHAQRRSS